MEEIEWRGEQQRWYASLSSGSEEGGVTVECDGCGVEVEDAGRGGRKPAAADTVVAVVDTAILIDRDPPPINLLFNYSRLQVSAGDSRNNSVCGTKRQTSTSPAAPTSQAGRQDSYDGHNIQFLRL